MFIKRIIKKIIPSFVLIAYHWFLAILASFWYCFPSRKLKVIGVTGTNGKSTVVHLLTTILEQAGYKVGSISSIRFKIGDKEWPNELKITMPGRFQIQKFLYQCLRSKCDYVVLEITSEGIKQFRHKNIKFKGAILTNLTEEHIESHGSFENYRKAKEKLFASLKGRKGTFMVINKDDEYADYFLRYNAEHKFTYSLKEVSYWIGKFSSEFKIDNQDFTLNLSGEFNIANALAAITAVRAEGISLDIAAKGIQQVKIVPGRLEKISDNPLVIVDYAHTPDALEKVYKNLSDIYQQKPLICVFGSAGGGRDKWKRPEMGKIAAQYCQEIILTNEDPYDENPAIILDEIAKEIVSNYNKILDRREAIKLGIQKAKELNGVAIITGKGSEPWIMGPNGQKIPWSDKKIVLEISRL